MILLIDNYDSFTYNVKHYLSEIGAKVKTYRNDKVSVKEIKEINRSGENNECILNQRE